MKISVKKIKDIMNEEINSILEKENKELKLSKEFATKFLECFDINPSKNKILYEKIYKSFSKNQKILESITGISSLAERFLRQAPPRAACLEYFKSAMQEQFQSELGAQTGQIAIEKNDVVEEHIRHIKFKILGEDEGIPQTFSVWYVSINNDEYYYAHGKDVYFSKSVPGNITINPQPDDQKIDGIRLYGEW